MDRERLDQATQAIRDYTSAHRQLQVAHHFVFDLPLDKSAGKPEIVVMGIHPGEVESQWQVPGPTEETWNFRFYDSANASRSSQNWFRNTTFFADGRPVVLTEMFFWSASNENQFKERFGELWKSPHLRFCVSMNKVLIQEYQPEMVVCPGLGLAENAAKLFGLRYIRTVSGQGKRLVEHYRDDRRPWFFTRHWSGSFGFSQAQKTAIKEYIHAQRLS